MSTHNIPYLTVYYTHFFLPNNVFKNLMLVINRNTIIRIEIAKIIGRKISLQWQSNFINETLIERCKIHNA